MTSGATLLDSRSLVSFAGVRTTGGRASLLSDPAQPEIGSGRLGILTSAAVIASV